MTGYAETVAVRKTLRPLVQTFCLSVTGGAFIALGFVFCITVTTGAGALPWGIVKLIGGICFSLGLILIIVCGADLFTSTVLSTTALAAKRIKAPQMALNWLNVYVGNLLGALIIVALTWYSGEASAAGGRWGLNVLATAHAKLSHTFIQAFCLGVFANLMVCLAVWMSYAGHSLLDKSLIVIAPISMFVAGGFEHCIANMFLIPLAILIRDGSGPDFWQSVGAAADHYPLLTVGNFITLNLLPVTLGNIVGGGLMVGAWNRFLFSRETAAVSGE
jgi:formate transporter